MRLPILALAALAVSAPAKALDLPPVCKALKAMAIQAPAAGPQRATLGPAGCEPAASPFCQAAGGYPLNLAPWAAWDCVNTMSSDPQVTTGAADGAPPKGKRIAHLAAKLGGGVRLDLAAAGERYDLVVWKP